MIYLSAQPASLYYGWQIDVMLHIFVGQGVNVYEVIIENEVDDVKENKYGNL